MNDEQADKVIECLVGIGAELSAIRQELQKRNAPAEPQVEIGCGVCGEVLHSTEEAKRHAKTEHNAPNGAWRSLYA